MLGEPAEHMLKNETKLCVHLESVLLSVLHFWLSINLFLLYFFPRSCHSQVSYMENRLTEMFHLAWSLHNMVQSLQTWMGQI